MSGWTLLALACALPAVLAGCGNDPLAPFQPEVSNLPGTFQLQATGVAEVSNTISYTWSNTAAVANVNQATTTNRGSARLIILDAAGDEVYNEILQPSVNEQTNVGTAGDWTVRLELSNYSGTLNFRLETP